MILEQNKVNVYNLGIVIIKSSTLEEIDLNKCL